MRSIEKEAKSVDEAIFKGLAQLGLSISEVKIDILEEGSKGFLNILGSKLAKVRITEKQNESSIPIAFIEGLLENMGIAAILSEEVSEQAIIIRLSGEKIGSIIGHRGETLDAIQYLTSLVTNRNREEYIRVTVDAENYRDKREQALIRLANNMAERAQKTGHKVALEPMNPFERRVLHATLHDNKYVTTISEGEDPNRRVVIIPTR